MQTAARSHDPDLAIWLAMLDPLPLECDGMTRCISTVLSHMGRPHTVHFGELAIDGVGSIPLHFWIELSCGLIIDLRARMWLGEGGSVPGSVPHGVFEPKPHMHYLSHGIQADFTVSQTIFEILTGLPMHIFC